MKRIPFRLVLIAVAIAFVALPGKTSAQNADVLKGAAQSAAVSPATFAAELRQLDDRLASRTISAKQLAAVRASIPDSWEIDTPERHYSISSRQLISMLRIAENNADLRAEQVSAARAWLTDFSQQVEAYSDQPGNQGTSARAKTEQILSRREFAGVGKVDPRSLLRRKINEWLYRFFSWLFGRIGRHPIATETFFWLIVAGLVVWLSMTLFRYWLSGAKMESIEKISTVAFHRPWQEWIRAAREAAARGDFREAVHSTYWAGVSRLETLGALEPDPARTPRESLRVLSDPAGEGMHATAQQRESLTALTSCLERVWYGHRAAGVNEFQDCLRQAEELGCRLS